MGRPRGFDESAVVAAAAGQFLSSGYEGTSVDDLVTASGLHRGSLYTAFGSKRGIFLAALRHVVTDDLPASVAAKDDLVEGSALDLVIVAALELAPRDDEVRELVDQACALLTRADGGDEYANPPALFGRRLLRRAHVTMHQSQREEG